MIEQEEKRKGTKPIPDDPLEYLNEAQLFTYRRMATSGWHIKFIRRPKYHSPVCVMTDSDESMLALIERNGFLNKQPDIPLRSNEKWAKE
ncbi:MAG: hypothetical protein U9N50_06605 [Pseudomonadota bacterium]|nr:hypothetical protein [Pseudomonadota bacterium]